MLLTLLLLKLLYNICKVPGFEPEYLRPQISVVPMIHTIEEVWKQKQRQTVVFVFLGKTAAAHMAL